MSSGADSQHLRLRTPDRAAGHSAAPDIPGGPEQAQPPLGRDAVGIQQTVVDAGLGLHWHAATVVTAVAHGEMQRTQALGAAIDLDFQPERA